LKCKLLERYDNKNIRRTRKGALCGVHRLSVQLTVNNKNTIIKPNFLFVGKVQREGGIPIASKIL
jgi:hypothetical protein